MAWICAPLGLTGSVIIALSFVDQQSPSQLCPASVPSVAVLLQDVDYGSDIR